MHVVAHKRFEIPKPPSTRAIFTVAVTSTRDMSRTRCWGWYSRFENAEAAVLANATDMFECGYYSHAVIEEYPEGLVPIPKSARWYRADYGKPEPNVYPMPVVTKLRRRPAAFKNLVSFGIG